MSKNNRALKAGIWYTIANFFVKGITFLTMPIFTRIMTTEDIGVFSNITSWFNILAIITSFELFSSVAIARFDYEEDLDSYISSTLFLGSIITLIFYVIIVLNFDFFENILSMNFETVTILFAYLLFYPAIQMFQKKKQIEYKYISTIVVSVGSSVLSSIFSILAVLLCSNALRGRIYGYYIPLVIFSLIIYIYLMIRGKSISRKYWKYALVVSFPLIWHLLAGSLLNSSDRIMILKLENASKAAFYSVATSCSMMVSILWSSMNTAWSPWAFEVMNKKDYSSLKKNSKPYFIFFFVIAIIFMLLAPEILYIMGGKEYMQAVYVIPPVMVGYIFQFVYSFYVNIEYYHKKQKYIAIGTIIAAIINIVLNLIFIPLFGYIAAAYTTLIGYIALYFIHYVLVKRMGYKNWYDNLFFQKFLLISIIIMLFLSLIYNYIIIRYFLIFIILIVVIILFSKNKSILIKIIKTKSLEPIKDFKIKK